MVSQNISDKIACFKVKLNWTRKSFFVVFDLVHAYLCNQSEINSEDKVCEFNLVQTTSFCIIFSIFSLLLLNYEKSLTRSNTNFTTTIYQFPIQIYLTWLKLRS